MVQPFDPVTEEEETHAPLSEPSAWDYLRARLLFWRGERIEIKAPEDAPTPVDVVTAEAPAQQDVQTQPEASTSVEAVAEEAHIALPWRSLLAILLALAGQLAFEPPMGPEARSPLTGLLLYGVALILAGLAAWSGEWRLPSPTAQMNAAPDWPQVRRTPFALGVTFSLAAFIFFGGNQFNWLNVSLWIAGLVLVCASLWDWRVEFSWQAVWDKLRQPAWSVKISAFGLLLLFGFGVAAFFRFYQLEQTPPEMVSDHAEKLFDVYEVLQGQTRIFFPRNTGREAFQMYLIAATSLIFGGLNFLTMKIGTAGAGLLTLPFIYLLGKEIGGKRAGWLALILAGMAYWPNVISRAALRFTLYPFFTAPLMYFLVRGLRRGDRNDFIWAGIFLGLGLHGYSTYRIVPFLVVLAVLLFILHRAAGANWRFATSGLIITGVISLIVFLPLLRYTVEFPEMVSYRALTRIADLERDLPGSPLQILASNMLRGLSMFNWDNGGIWVHSVIGRPALDVVSGALFLIGAALVLLRYIRRRDWVDGFLLLSIIVLLLPSVLSLAFPDENPSLNRTGGAIIPVFILIGLAFDGLLTAIERYLPRQRWLPIGLAVLLLAWSAVQNYDIVFRQYQRSYELSAWNTSEMGAVASSYLATIGEPDTVYVLAYPYWVDTRLVALNAGEPYKDYAISPEDAPDTVNDPRTKLFLIKADDTAGLELLRQLYPAGIESLYPSAIEGKEFIVFLAPGQTP